MTDSNDNQSMAPADDFAAMLEEFGGGGTLKLSVGSQVQAELVHLSDISAFFQLSPTQEGSMSLEELRDNDGELTAVVGDKLDVYVIGLDGGIELSRRVGRGQIDVDMLMSAKESQMPIEGTVTGFNDGGLEISMGGARGFCPMGQIDMNFVEEPASWVGKTLEFAVREVKERGRNVIVSRKVLLQAKRHEQAAKLMLELEEGQERVGEVSRVLKFGAFVDIGGVDGLVPISELSYSRVQDPTDVVSPGDRVTVRVMRIEDDPKREGQKRISLSIKAATPDPFQEHAPALTDGSVHEGLVARVETFGAFVELFPGVQGLIHISELSDRRIGHPREVVEVGQTVQVRVLSLDLETQRIGLSLRSADQVASDGTPVAGAKPKGAGFAVGDMVTGKVDRIERYGVFLVLEGGGRALLPAAETGTDRGTDLGRVFPKESEIKVRVIEIDERDRIKVSKVAFEQAEERATVAAYNEKSTGSGFGNSFGDLLKKSLKK